METSKARITNYCQLHTVGTMSQTGLVESKPSHLRAALICSLHRRRRDLASLRISVAKVVGFLHGPLPLPELRRCMMKHPARAPMSIPPEKYFPPLEALDLDGHLLHLVADTHPYLKLVRHAVGGVAIRRPRRCEWCRWGLAGGTTTCTSSSAVGVAAFAASRPRRQ